jgi:hypothetical protein
MLKVDCRRCGKELDVPGALVFGVPDTDGGVSKHHVCIFCWDHLLAWIYRDADVVFHGRGLVPPSPCPAISHSANEVVAEWARQNLRRIQDARREGVLRSAATAESSRVCGKEYQGGACRLPLGHAGHCQD